MISICLRNIGAVGEGYFEDIAKELELHGWKCPPGGSSDTETWASHEFQGVNISAGY